MDAAHCAPRRAPARVLLGAVRVGGVGRGAARRVHKPAAADTGVAGAYNIFSPFVSRYFSLATSDVPAAGAAEGGGGAGPGQAASRARGAPLLLGVGGGGLGGRAAPAAAEPAAAPRARGPRAPGAGAAARAETSATSEHEAGGEEEEGAVLEQHLGHLVTVSQHLHHTGDTKHPAN